MKCNRSLLICCVLALLSAACSGSADLEKSLRSELRDLRGLQAEQSTELSQLREDVRALNGRIEELEYRSQGRTKELERTVELLGSRVPPPAGVPEELLRQDEEAIARISSPAALEFRKGLQLLRTGDFDQARKIFSRFAEENPGTAFSDNALFWSGIAYYKLGYNDQAIIAFSEVFQKYPAEDRVPAALFELAETFARMGSTSDAVATFRKLIDEHPRSPYSVQAKKRIPELERSGRRR